MTIETYKNRYDGERIFILGNGPSLGRTPLHLLSDEYTFGVNNIANIFEQTDWRPSFYLAIHDPPNIPKDNVEKVIDLNVPCFFPDDRLQYIPDKENVERFNKHHLSEKPDIDVTDYHINWESIGGYRDVWSEDVSDVVYQYTTVLYSAMQIANYLGFSEYYLLGCDLYDEWDLHMIFEKGADPATYRPAHDSKPAMFYEFLSSSDYPLRSFVNGVAYKLLNSVLFRKAHPYLLKIDDRFANKAHFYDSYDVGKLLAGNQIRNGQMIRAHRLAKEVSSEARFDIYNATLGGSLEVHPRVDLYELLEE